MSRRVWQRMIVSTWRIWLACGLLGSTASAAERVSHPEGWGLGVMLGSPIGLTAKYWLGGANALDFGVGGGPGFRVHGDYTWGLAQVLENKRDLTLDLYLGAGGALAIASGFCTYYGDRFCQDRVFGGLRVPIGLDARLRRAPVNFGIEFAPGIWFGSYVTGLFDVFVFCRFLL